MDNIPFESIPKPIQESEIHIIVVEDSAVFQEYIVLNLRRLGYQANGVVDSAGLYREMIENAADIVILDVNLPGHDGITIANQLRSMKRTRELGIIMLTSDTDMELRVKGLESGADVFLTKPVNLEEMNAQIKSLYRRLLTEPIAAAPKSWKFCKNTWKLTSPTGIEIPLTHLETLFIEAIAIRSGRPVDRRDIIATALVEDPLKYDYRRLDALVSRLRKKIMGYQRDARPIKSAHSIGYIFAEPILLL